MSRLLFAAARKARIEYPKPDGSGWQIFVMNVPIERNDDCRIHPEDAHLAYGPISTALRESAVTTNISLAYSVSGFLPLGAVCEYTPTCRGSDWTECQNELHRSIFLLILAESLADEGL